MPTDALVTPQGTPSRTSFWVGATLMVVSFAIYPAYPLLPFLPMSTWQKGGVGIALAAVSWGMFLAGCALAGKKGVAYLKRRFLWQRDPRPHADLTRSG